MKFVDQEYYEVKNPRGMYGLAERFDSFEEAIEGGKRMNETEISLGYKASEWIVTRTKWSRIFDENGMFICESSSTVALAK